VGITFRAKLLLIVGTAVLALCAVLLGSAFIAERQAADLQNVEGRLIPKLEIGPRLEAHFERLTLTYQNAVATRNSSALSASWGMRDELFELIRAGSSVLEPAAAASLRWAIQDYAVQAHEVSKRLIAGETGGSLVEDMRQMQARQDRAQKLIAQTLRLRPNEASAAFAAVRTGGARAHQFRLAIGLSSFALLIVLSLWVTRGVLSAVDELSRGFARFATGDFTWRIPVRSADEFGRMAREANQMAENLRRLNGEHTRDDWLKAGQVGLSDALRGDLDPNALAQRALAFMAHRLDAVAGAFYVANADGGLTLAGEYAEGAARQQTFRAGEGLLGQSVLSDDLMLVEGVPADYSPVRSGLGGSSLRTLLFLPLKREGQPVGVIELGLFGECSERMREWLLSIRETLVVSLAAARSRADLEAQRQELSDKNVELEEARLHLQQKAEELSRVSSYKSRFLANVSHELRTPLNSMLLLSQLLSQNESGNLTPRQVEHAKTVHSAGEDLLSLINQVLDLSKIEAGHQELHLEDVPLDHFIEHARRVFEPLAAEKRLSLLFEVAPGVPQTIYTDRQRVERILVNLLGNAIKFTERGKVSLSIGRPSGTAAHADSELDLSHSIAFSVTDTGVGIAEQARERVFAPFEQLESHTDRRYSGTGLGLAIARESALLLGGELRLESTLGRGSTFTCYLPERAQARQQALDQRQRRNSSVADDRERLQEGPGHLLIVEDDTVFAEQLLDIVHARGFQAVVAGSGEEALGLARALRPQGVLLDVRLPDIDGWTVMERLRADPATNALPVHFVSAVDERERGLALGAVGYLVKPTTHAKLVGAVRALTPRAAQEPTRVLVVEDDSLQGEMLVHALHRGGIEARCVDNASAALEEIERDLYACMILDLGLPDMDGLDLLERLTQRTSLDPPHVVVHTGRALTRAERTALDTYADAVVTKGDSSVKRLLEEIRRFVTDLPDYATREALLLSDNTTRSISLEGAKLLLAEDDMRTVYAISALLQASGAKVLIADSGRDALEMLSKNPDVNGVLMDVMMPEMDGYEAIRHLRSDPRFSDLPVVALTGRPVKGERERCLQAGANGYLAKPIDSEQLLSTVGAWLLPENSHGH
jgi:CheY-like chemotaxis protein/signal transduction histidine kinase/HAMP domain-containing protein